MPKLNVTIPHQLGTTEARSRIQGAVAEAMGRYGDKVSNLQERWEGDRGEFSGKAMGFNLSGTVTVHPDAVEIQGESPSPPPCSRARSRPPSATAAPSS